MHIILQSGKINMREELLEIVDENDNLTGITKPRSEVHKNSVDWHRATHIWIVDKDDRILCQQRSWQKDSNPGKWQSFFGGHIKAGQSYEENAIEELKEELGIKAGSAELKSIYMSKNAMVRHFIKVFVLRIREDLKQTINPGEELEALRWLTTDTLKELIGKDIFCNVFDGRIIEYLSHPTQKVSLPLIVEE